MKGVNAKWQFVICMCIFLCEVATVFHRGWLCHHQETMSRPNWLMIVILVAHHAALSNSPLCGLHFNASFLPSPWRPQPKGQQTNKLWKHYRLWSLDTLRKEESWMTYVNRCSLSSRVLTFQFTSKSHRLRTRVMNSILMCLCVFFNGLCHRLAQPAGPRVVWPGHEHRGMLCASARWPSVISSHNCIGSYKHAPSGRKRHGRGGKTVMKEIRKGNRSTGQELKMKRNKTFITQHLNSNFST